MALDHYYVISYGFPLTSQMQVRIDADAISDGAVIAVAEMLRTSALVAAWGSDAYVQSISEVGSTRDLDISVLAESQPATDTETT